MGKMSKRTRRKIYNRIAMRFRRRAKEMGRPDEWKFIEINGRKFDEYLDEAIKNYDPNKENLTADEMIEEFKKGILGEPDEEPQHMKKKTDYEIDPQLLRLWNRESEEQREREIKQIAREFNENVEEQMRKSICPVCKSSVCRCRN